MTRLLAALLLATPAMAQDMPACGSRTALTSMLAEDFGEVRRGSGLTYEDDAPVAAVEVYANPETGTWTMLTALPTGEACITAFGRNWSDAGPKGRPA